MKSAALWISLAGLLVFAGAGLLIFAPTYLEHRDRAQLLELPITTTPEGAGPHDEVAFHCFQHGAFGVTDIGPVRIAIRGLENVTVTRSMIHLRSSGARWGPSQPNALSYQNYGNVTTCTFGNAIFTIEDGVMLLDTDMVRLDGTDQTVFLLDIDGAVQEVIPIP